MKVWWLCRKKDLLSLFSERIKWPSELQGAPRLHSAVAENPHSKNAPGAFFVTDSECISCGYPHVLAPDVMAWEMDDQGRHNHCYFKKQPETANELIQAIKA